jgi:hypothetical protein
MCYDSVIFNKFDNSIHTWLEPGSSVNIASDYELDDREK